MAIGDYSTTRDSNANIAPGNIRSNDYTRDQQLINSIRQLMADLASTVETKAWTPTITFDTPGDLSVTYTEQIGRYQKVGKFITVVFDVVTATFTHTTASGQLRIAGLPFACANITNLEMTGAVEASNIILPAGYTWLNVQAFQNLSTLRLVRSGSGVSRNTITTAEAPSGVNKTIFGSVTYETAT